MVLGQSGGDGCNAALAALLRIAVVSAGWRVTQSNVFQQINVFLDAKFIICFVIVSMTWASSFANPAQELTKRAFSSVNA